MLGCLCPGSLCCYPGLPVPGLWAGFGSVFALSPVWAWFFLWLVGLFVGSGLMFGGLLCFGF